MKNYTSLWGERSTLVGLFFVFIPLPVLICCSATLSLSGTFSIIQGVYPNSGSAAAVVPGILSESSIAGTLPEPWFPNVGFPGYFKIGIPVIPEPWYNAGSGYSKPWRWFPESYRNPLLLEPCRNPGFLNFGFPGYFKIGIPVIPEPWHNHGSACSKPWSCNLRLMEPCPRTLGSRNLDVPEPRS